VTRRGPDSRVGPLGWPAVGLCILAAVVPLHALAPHAVRLDLLAV
jgi:hypothetical protein